MSHVPDTPEGAGGSAASQSQEAAEGSPPGWATRLRPTGVSATQGVGLLLLYVGMVVFFAWASPFFLTVNNFLNIGTNIAYIGIMAVAMTMVIVSGGFDLSVGAVVALSAVTIAKIHDLDIDIWIAVAAAFAIGPVVGLVNGLIVTKVGINPLITTLGTLSIVRGAAYVLTGGLTGTILDASFAVIGRGSVMGIPVPMILLAVIFVAVHVVMTATPFGRNLYAIGGNAEASRLAGVNVDRHRIAVYVLSGASASIAGIVLASQLGAGAPQSAQGVELSVIAAVILGGTSLSGGRGTVWGTLLGVIIMGTLNNGLALMRVSSFYQEIARGVVLLLAVGLDQLASRRRR
ncbi:MAG TPA: ABC transporter permease [Candidatus Limnocylindrales bacterium]|nr:ABC transporter permease [Candidatus Limnocylindrales bacterium]